MVYTLIMLIAIVIMAKKIHNLNKTVEFLVDENCTMYNKLASIEEALNLEPNETDNQIEAICFPYKGKNPLNTFED